MTTDLPRRLVIDEDPAAVQQGREAARAARAAAMADMVRVNPFADPPEVCAARAADPAWQARQAELNDASSARFLAYRETVGLPLVRKKAGERF